jgi:hypothetical protein
MFLVNNIGGHLMDIINHEIGQENLLEAWRFQCEIDKKMIKIMVK